VKRPGIVKTAILLLPLQIVLRASEALLPLLLGAWFGRSRSTDVYYFTWAFFQLTGSLVFAAYQDSAAIPILTEAKLAGKRTLETVTGSLLAHTVLVGAALAAGAAVVAVAVLRAAHGGEELELASRMVPLFAAFLVVLGTRTFFEAWLVVEQRYFSSPVCRGAGAAVMLAVAWLGRARLGIVAVPFALLAGELVSTSALVWVVFGKLRRTISLNLSRPEPVRRFGKLAASEVAGATVTRINPVVDQLMAAVAGVAGGGTLLSYSLDAALVPTSVLQATLLPLLLSRFSDDIARGNIRQFRADLAKSLVAVTTLLLAVGLAMLALRGPILRLAFLRGAMDPAGVERMIGLLPYHLLGLAPFGALLVLTRAHIALKNSSIMFSMGVLNAAMNLVLDFVLVRFMGLEGVALATSLVHAVVAIVFFARLEPGVRRLGGTVAT
jgi:putative peptidoglycan lipid II flippase